MLAFWAGQDFPQHAHVRSRTRLSQLCAAACDAHKAVAQPATSALALIIPSCALPSSTSAANDGAVSASAVVQALWDVASDKARSAEGLPEAAQLRVVDVMASALERWMRSQSGDVTSLALQSAQRAARCIANSSSGGSGRSDLDDPDTSAAQLRAFSLALLFRLHALALVQGWWGGAKPLQKLALDSLQTKVRSQHGSKHGFLGLNELRLLACCEPGAVAEPLVSAVVAALGSQDRCERAASEDVLLQWLAKAVGSSVHESIQAAMKWQLHACTASGPDSGSVGMGDEPWQSVLCRRTWLLQARGRLVSSCKGAEQEPGTQQDNLL